MSAQNRFFFQCRSCFLKFTADAEAGQRAPRVEACPVCDDRRVKCLGSTRGVVKLSVPCNDKCVFAEGPDCSCSCGGKNHGLKLLVPVVSGVVEFTGKGPLFLVERIKLRWDKWNRDLAATHEAPPAFVAEALAVDFRARSEAQRQIVQRWNDWRSKLRHGCQSWQAREKALAQFRAAFPGAGVVASASAVSGGSSVEVQHSLSPMARPGDLFAWGDKWAHISPQFRGHQFGIPEVRDASGAVLSEAVNFSPQ